MKPSADMLEAFFGPLTPKGGSLRDKGEFRIKNYKFRIQNSELAGAWGDLACIKS
jgi:hypothetical protein